VARAEAALGAARAFLYSTLSDLWRVTREGGQPSPRQLALSRLAAANASETGASVARTAGLLAGANALYDSSALQRFDRDADALAHHFTVSAHTWEDAGRVFLGRQPLAPIF
jgi:alkylation response protein AidB-like acyl-CoA dehydrogenase